ncbi:prolyl 4-hydroxylase subunit alpha-2 [Drosophila eugracilis]|uniref:prolyl 4-hydroxylase subunit alpha-2 n=1 Tax=Drosophila eugracilis TaxID=29029 RepID=UPI0007E71947|nr:prolyl 4-hydroxylase subunit alpha-2 [Drosophila eugracilis]
MSKLNTTFFPVCLLVLAASLAKTYVVENNYATSIYDMGKLVSYELYLLNTLEKFSEKLQQRVDTIEHYLQMMEYEESGQLPTHPIDSFRVVRRLYSDYANWVWYLEQQPWEAYVLNITAIAAKMPTTKDMGEATRGLELIQSVYSISTRNMAQGVFREVHSNISLNAMECYTIAKDMVKYKNLTRAMEWLNVGVEKYMEDEQNEENYLYTQLGVTLVSFHELLVEIKEGLGSRTSALAELEAAIGTWSEKVSLRRTYARLAMNIRIGKEPPLKEEQPQGVYEQCCSVECRPIGKLVCLYNTTASPFLRLAPLKMELLSLDPYMVLYHDVLSERDIIGIKNLAQGSLVPALTISSNISLQERPARTTNGAWIKQTDGVMLRMTQLTQDMTNFDLHDSEIFQVMNYGIGGYYAIHYDFFGYSLQTDFSDRISTALFYLSDVTLGGATVFPSLRLSVFPKKGSALLWYNLDHKGDGDVRTLHSACPTVVGSRWVMTKWIREWRQLFKRPCLKNI